MLYNKEGNLLAGKKIQIVIADDNKGLSTSLVNI